MGTAAARLETALGILLTNLEGLETTERIQEEQERDRLLLSLLKRQLALLPTEQPELDKRR